MPEDLENWEGIKPAVAYGPCMQWSSAHLYPETHTQFRISGILRVNIAITLIFGRRVWMIVPNGRLLYGFTAVVFSMVPPWRIFSYDW